MPLSKLPIVAISVLASVCIFGGCTTANYGQAPAAAADRKDSFLFKVYAGGLTGPDTADAAVKKDIDAYQKANDFKENKIISKRYNFIPSYFEYLVQFSK